MAHSESELRVITAAKNLLSYIMSVTQKSPKQFRFSLIGRLQTYAMDVVEELYCANDIFMTPAEAAERLRHQRRAMSRLKLLVYVAQVSMEQNAIQAKQYEQISMQAYATENMLGAWIQGDKKRLSKM